MSRLFGTDGIRGLANEYPMTGDLAMAVGRAVALMLREHPELCTKSSLPVGLKPLESRKPVRRPKVVVGKDTRLANYMIETAIVSGLCSMGADAIIIGPLPTPGVAFVTQSMRADAGIMISASHNPYHDTGIKIFGSDGYKLPDAYEEKLEKLVQDFDLKGGLPTGDLIGKAYRIEDAIGRYIVYLKTLLPREQDLLGMRIVVDCANGAAYKVAPLVFEELGAEVIRKGVEPNGLNINENCGALHPEAVAAATAEYRADLGVALDGDGDRCILSDENGEIVDGDQMIGLCAIQMHREGRLAGKTVVTTPMSNVGLELTLKDHGIQMLRANVGDRYVVETMRKHGLNLGGEQSGHLIFTDHARTGDGIVAALKVIEAMRTTGKTLSELKREIRLLPQFRTDVRVSKKLPLEDIPDIRASMDRARSELENKGRIFVRYSGTEPLARILVEGEDALAIERIAGDVRTVVQRHLGV